MAQQNIQNAIANTIASLQILEKALLSVTSSGNTGTNPSVSSVSSSLMMGMGHMLQDNPFSQEASTHQYKNHKYNYDPQKEQKYDNDTKQYDNRRHAIEESFLRENYKTIQTQELYRLELQNKRHKNELVFWNTRKKSIKELDALETELSKKRLAQELNEKLSQAKALSEVEGNTKLGKVFGDKEIKDKKTGRIIDYKKGAFSDSEAKKNLESFLGDWYGSSRSRKSGLVANSVASGLNKAANFLSSDKQVSISDVGNKIADVAGNFGPWGKTAGALVQIVTSIVEAYDKVNAAASKYSRIVGGGLTKMTQMKNDSTMIAYSITNWGSNAYKFDDILEHITELSSKTGRVMDHMSVMDIKSLEDLTRYGINSDTLNMYDTFGLSIETIDKRITDIYKTSGRHGLNAKAVTDAVNKNLKLAQNYTFAGGQRALERMAEKSVALKYNIEAAARFADKVSTLEGAAQAGAQLSVLGGDFARMGNPLSMLYGGLQDPERLNDMMLNMTKNMAHWDSQNREMRISAYNRQRLKAAADAMGVDYNDLINQSMMQGKRNRIDSQIGNGITDEDTREYIRNLAQLDENGNAYIRFSGDKKPTYLNELTPESKEKLKKESEAMGQKDKAKIGDVWQETRTITDKLNDYIQWVKTAMFRLIAKIAGATDEEQARAKGLNAKNAEMFEDFSDDYASGGVNKRTKKALEKLGASEEDVKKAYDKGFDSQEEFDNWLIDLIKKKQDEGYTYKGNSWWSPFDYAYINAGDKDWFDKNFTKSEVKKQAHGGIIRGKGTSTSDSIPAMLSDGEFVMNAKATQKHLPTLQAWNNAERFSIGSIMPIKAGSNLFNPLSVIAPMLSGVQTQSPQSIHIDPLSVNINGTIKLDGGNGITKGFDAKNLLGNNTFISLLIREIEKAINYTLDKNKVHLKFPVPFV